MCSSSGLLQLFIDGFILLLRCDCPRLDTLLHLWHWNDVLQRVLGNVLQLRSRSVALPHTLCAGSLWEEHELGHVKLQPLDICLQALSASVSAAMVHCNPNGLCKFSRDLGFLQLVQSEALAQSKLHVVALGWRVHQRTQQPSGRAWEDLCCLFFPCVGSSLLSACLVQPGPHEHAVLAATLAAIDLSEVHIGNDVVT